MNTETSGANGFPAKLPEAEEALVEKSFEQKGIITTVNKIPIQRADFRRLKPGKWLNDELINAYMQLIQTRADSASRPYDFGFRISPLRPTEFKHNILCLSSFVIQKLIALGYAEGKLRSWTKNHNIFSLDRLLFPINHSNVHWTAASINFVEKRIESYDSSDNTYHARFKILRQYLDAEHWDKRFQPFDFEGWTNYTHPNQPLQNNGCDCGVFTCVTLEALARGEDDLIFDQSNMPYFRKRMGFEILNGALKIDG
ncbi:hypothetical protein CPB83DRAFT_939663 [Crepidotus variabilis]|uniref:Ubiquitin-like protease family profile domain-containing protein n=1 Tax=Crepidotus variabilis TaxID=179855 RepID=A0A9P6ERB0_9AGAR|nr:hypothetical protein CPB83DRAFT_939663 [Crepidotus variabilis]